MFAQVEAFGIDDGELDGVGEVQAFTLGVEWGLIYTHIQSRDPFHDEPVHTDNQYRLDGLLERQGYERSWRYGDDWCFLTAKVWHPFVVAPDGKEGGL